MRVHTALLALLAASVSGCATTQPAATPSAAPDQRPSAYQPKRIAPSAMEAWIAPWEDATGDLYPPSTVYIEVNPERWHYSGATDGRLTVLRPLQVQQRPLPEAETLGPALPPSPAAMEGAPAPFFAVGGARRGT